jgi:hypothetical protein
VDAAPCPECGADPGRGSVSIELSGAGAVLIVVGTEDGATAHALTPEQAMDLSEAASEAAMDAMRMRME